MCLSLSCIVCICYCIILSIYCLDYPTIQMPFKVFCHFNKIFFLCKMTNRHYFLFCDIFRYFAQIYFSSFCTIIIIQLFRIFIHYPFLWIFVFYSCIHFFYTIFARLFASRIPTMMDATNNLFCVYILIVYIFCIIILFIIHECIAIHCCVF